MKPYRCVKLLSCCDNTMAKGSLGVEGAIYPTPEKLGQQVWGKLLSGGTAHSGQCLPMSIANQEKDSGRSTDLSEAFFPLRLPQVPVGCVKLKLTRRHCASLSVRLINLSKMFCCTSITEAFISYHRRRLDLPVWAPYILHLPQVNNYPCFMCVNLLLSPESSPSSLVSSNF